MSSIKPIVHFTPAAIEHIQRELKQSQGIGFRLAVKQAGCSGYRYQPEIISEVNKDDLHFTTQEKLEVYIDPRSLDKLQGTTLDFVQKSLLEKQLVFHNPKAVGACGCGESFHIKERA